MRTQRLALASLLSLSASCGVAMNTPDAATPDASADRTASDATISTEDSSLDASSDVVVMEGDATSVDVASADVVSPTDATSMDAAVVNGGTVAVQHAREFRAAWVASVYNLTYPSRSGLSAAELRSELQALVAMAERVGLNAIVFQVRPESDAMYRSTIEPWSRFLSGTQGRDPGIDPLAELLTIAHSKAIEVHAWINPYRGAADTRFTTASNHITRTMSGSAITYNGVITMNPGVAAVRAHVVRVVRDIATRYAIDGVHFDDYFYPYPDASSTPYNDDATFNAYRSGGGTLSKADWRRDNVNRMVAESAAAIREARPTARFGVSPFGIYRPGMPSGIAGLDAYNAISCDPLAWVRAGSVDYLAPQLYWPTTQTAQAYGTLLPWWATQTTGRAYIFAGNSLERLGSSAAWTTNEIRQQIRISRMHRAQGSLGNVFFHGRSLLRDTMSVATALQSDFYGSPAIPPPLHSATGTVDPPTATAAAGRTIALSHAAAATLRAWAIYRYDTATSAFVLSRVATSSSANVTVTAGRWAVSAIALDDRESLGRVVDVD